MDTVGILGPQLSFLCLRSPIIIWGRLEILKRSSGDSVRGIFGIKLKLEVWRRTGLVICFGKGFLSNCGID